MQIINSNPEEFIPQKTYHSHWSSKKSSNTWIREQKGSKIKELRLTMKAKEWREKTFCKAFQWRRISLSGFFPLVQSESDLAKPINEALLFPSEKLERRIA